MKRGLAALVPLAVALALAAPAAAQTTGGSSQQPSQSLVLRLAHRFLTAPDTPGVPTFTIAFGGIKPGSGIALGPAVGLNFRQGSFVQVTAEYSLHDYKLVQVRYRSRDWLGKKLFLSSHVRWQDAPDVPLFQLGVDSPMKSASYGETRTEVSVTATMKPAPRWTLTAGTAFEHYRTTAGTVGNEDESLPAVPDIPGLAARTSFVHTYGGVTYDTRPSPDYSTQGWMLAGAVHDYHDTATGAFSFSGADAFGDLLLPGISRRGTFDFLGRAWTSRPADGATVPVFLMPYLGGGDYLRGYRLYRFRDRDALLLTIEHRTAVHEYIDVVGFVDGGAVSRTGTALGRSWIKPAYGAGVLVHSPKATVIRLDLVRSIEGYQIGVTFSSAVSGSL